MMSRAMSDVTMHEAGWRLAIRSRRLTDPPDDHAIRRSIVFFAPLKGARMTCWISVCVGSSAIAMPFAVIPPLATSRLR